MKKIILFLMLIFMVGCSGMDADKVKDSSLIEGSANSEVVSSTDSAQESPVEVTASDFLNDKNYTNIPTSFDEVVPPSPTDISGNDTIFSINSDEYMDIAPSSNKEIDLFTAEEKSFEELEKIMPRVTPNRTANAVIHNPTYDNSIEPYYDLSYAEIILDCDITWARDVEERVPYTDDIWRMYTIAKSDIGGYIYIFFDYDKTTCDTFLKAIIYVDKIYSEADFAHINVGDSINKIAQFDSRTAFINRCDFLFDYGTIAQWYYLDNGILNVAIQPDRTIKLKFLIEDHEWENLAFLQPIENPESRAYYLRIMPNDFPPAS